MLPRNFQRRYRRHLSHFKLLFQISRTRGSLHQLSRLRIHLVQEFDISLIQSRKNVYETNIVVLHNHVPQISLAHPPLLRSRPHPKSISSSRRRHAFVSFCALLMNQSSFFKREMRVLFFLRKVKANVLFLFFRSLWALFCSVLQCISIFYYVVIISSGSIM